MARLVTTLRSTVKRLLEAIVMLLMISLAVVVVLAVIYRKAGTSLVWYDEVVSIMLAWLTYYAAALAALKRAHLGFSGLIDSLPYKSRVVAVLIGDEWARLPSYANRVRAVFRNLCARPNLGCNPLAWPSAATLSTLIPAARAALRGAPDRLVYLRGPRPRPQIELPIVQIEALVKTGSVQDQPEKAGLANLTASLLDEGTTTRSATQLAEQIEFVGGVLEVKTTHDFTTAATRVLAKDTDLGFELLADILLHPSFQEPELQRVKKLILGEITAQKDDPGAVAGKAFSQLVFNGHPYSWPVNGTEETLPAISREDVQAFTAAPENVDAGPTLLEEVILFLHQNNRFDFLLLVRSNPDR